MNSTVEQSASFFVEKKILRELIEQCKGEDKDVLHFSVTLFIDGGINLRLIPANNLIKGMPTFHSGGQA